MWGIADGYIRWHKDNYDCMPRKWFYYSVPQQRIFSAGPVQFYYQPISWGCDKDHQYNPKQYEVRYGQIVPRDNAN